MNNNVEMERMVGWDEEKKISSQLSKLLLLLSHYHRSQKDTLNYHLLIVCMVYYLLYVPNWPLIFYFQVKNLCFHRQFSQYHTTSYVTMFLIILRGIGTFLNM